MSTPDQLLYSALHGTAMRYAAERRNLDEAIEELRQIAEGCNDILAEAAGITAGSWYASPATHVGYELIGAGMLILAGGGRSMDEAKTRSYVSAHADAVARGDMDATAADLSEGLRLQRRRDGASASSAGGQRGKFSASR
jgi:hypothetical protein